MIVARSTFLAAAAAQLLLPAVAFAQTPAPGPIRIGTTAGDSYAEPLYAKDMGFFQQAGLNTDVQVFTNGAGVTTALSGNALDVGITNAISLAGAFEHGIPFQFFASAGTYNRDEVALMVAADSPYHTARDLNGKTLGTTAIKDANSLHIIAWMDRNGGDSSTVQLVEIPFSAMSASILRGTVAAAPIAEPALTQAKAQGLRVIGHPMDVYGERFMVGGWFAQTSYIEAHRPLLRRLTAAIYQTAQWANAHADESAAILAKYSKIDLDLVKRMSRAPYGTSLTPAMLQPYLDIGFKYKYLDKQLKATDLIAKL
jgi:NitT/TauT family transport system substrate-binding protein